MACCTKLSHHAAGTEGWYSKILECIPTQSAQSMQHSQPSQAATCHPLLCWATPLSTQVSFQSSSQICTDLLLLCQATVLLCLATVPPLQVIGCSSDTCEHSSRKLECSIRPLS